MSWSFTIEGATASQAIEQPHVANKGSLRVLVNKDGMCIISKDIDPAEDDRKLLGTFDIGEHLTFRAEVLPVLLQSKLSAPDHMVIFSTYGITISCCRQTSEVEVKSSAPGPSQGTKSSVIGVVKSESERHSPNAEQLLAGSQASDTTDDDLDIIPHISHPTVSPNTQTRVYSTAPSVQVVQETPTANRKRNFDEVDSAEVPDGANSGHESVFDDGSIETALASSKSRKKRKPDEDQTTPSTTRNNKTAKSSSKSSTAKSKVQVVFSSSEQDSEANKKLLRGFGVVIRDSFDRNRGELFVCTDASLKSTPKILSALISDQPIISDTWVAACQEADRLVDPYEYQIKEQSENVADRSKLFEGQSVAFTPAVLKFWGDGAKNMHQILKSAGAEVAKKAVGKDLEREDGLIIGLDTNDTTAAALAQKGCKVYRREVIASSIIAAQLQLDNEEMKLFVDAKDENIAKIPAKKRKKKA